MGLDQDAGIIRGEETEASLQKIDAFLCDLKEMQIRDGLAHFRASAPEGRLLTDLTVALARLPRRDGEGRERKFAPGDCGGFAVCRIRPA